MSGRSLKQERMRFALFVSIAFMIFFYSGCNNQKELERQVVGAEELLELTDLEPKIDIRAISHMNNGAAMDYEGNLYFLDKKTHLVLKFSSSGDFIQKIGQTGKGKEDLLFPGGLFFRDERLYILNNGGKDVKIFDTCGKFIDWVELDGAARTDSLVVDHGKLYLDTRYNYQYSYNSQPLISVFSEWGGMLSTFGNVIKSHKYMGYYEFNSTFLALYEGRIYGAFKNVPVIFCYTLKGEEIFYRDLRKYGIPEISRLDKIVKEHGLNQPMAMESAPGNSRFIHYFRGMGVKDGEICLPVNYWDKTWEAVVLSFDSAGKPSKKYLLQVREDYISRICKILDRGDAYRYIIGYKGNEDSLCLFRIDLKNNNNAGNQLISR